MKLSDYLRGDKLSPEAHNMELESMKDPFLYEAMEGYDSVEDDHIRHLESLEKELSSGKIDFSNFFKIAGIVVLALALIFGVVYVANNIPKLKIFSHKETVENTEDSTEDYSPSQARNAAKPQKDDTSKIVAPSASDTSAVDPDMLPESAGKPRPEIGMKEYYKYLKDNISVIKQSKCGGQGGTVVVSFLVSRKGNPHKIKIIKGFCPAVNRMLIKLILSGSRWTYGTTPDSKVTMPINF